jgi:5-methyltetrahydrofolate--homocysteine methyltransferase
MLLDELSSGVVVLMDGAMGTELQRAGLQSGACAELWNLTRPELVRAVHERYVSAGARCLLTNTFQANPRALERHGLRHRMEEINQAAIEIARAAGGPDCFVLGDIGPLGDGASEDEIRDLVDSLCGADALFLETFSDRQDLDQVMNAVRQQSPAERLPVLFSMTYRKSRDGRIATYAGMAPDDVARDISSAGIAALGVNCGRDIGMEDVVEIIRRYRSATSIPLFARPNAGTPERVGSSWRYPHTPQAMASRVPDLLDAGVTMIGGCCGTNPDHIEAFRLRIEEWNQSRRAENRRGE